MRTWNEDSGIRERLALLASRGPITLVPVEWTYDPHRDIWSRGAQRVPVKQEGSASLALILERWHMDRVTAMAFIGYPEAK